MRLFQQALFDAAFGTFAAEQDLFHPLGLDRGGRDRDEGGCGAIGLAMNEARRHFLAGSGRTGQHDAAIRFRHLLKLCLQPLEGRRISKHLGRRDFAAAQIAVFAP